MKVWRRGHRNGLHRQQGEPSFLHTQRHPFIMSLVWDFCSISWFVSIFFGFVELIHRLIQLPGPGLGHGNKRNHHSRRALHERVPGRNAQWWRTPGAVAFKKFFQSRWVERDICLCQLRMKKHKATTTAEARDPMVLVSSHPETHQNQPTFSPILVATGEFACRPSL